MLYTKIYKKKFVSFFLSKTSFSWFSANIIYEMIFKLFDFIHKETSVFISNLLS